MNAIPQTPTDYAEPHRAHLLSRRRELRRERIARLVKGLQHLKRILILAHLALVWIGALVLVDLNDRRVVAEERAAAAEKRAAVTATANKNWDCTELKSRAKPRLWLCNKLDVNRSY